MVVCVEMGITKNFSTCLILDYYKSLKFSTSLKNIRDLNNGRVIGITHPIVLPHFAVMITSFFPVKITLLDPGVLLKKERHEGS